MDSLIVESIELESGMRQVDILNQVRKVVGLPLAITAISACHAEQRQTVEPLPEGPTIRVPGVPTDAPRVSALIGTSSDPVADYLSYSQRLAVVGDCLERFPACPESCNLEVISPIRDADVIAERELVVTGTRFQIVGDSTDCSDVAWTFERTYCYSEEPGCSRAFAPHGSKLYESVGDAVTGEVRSIRLVGTVQIIPGRPFNGHVADASISTDNPWILAAQHEHSSVASFARHLLEMMSLGAPMHILQSIASAQQDELRHTEVCLRRAAEDGVTVELGPLDCAVPARRSIYEIARGVALEGCINETLAAFKLVDDMVEATAADAALMKAIVVDEVGHAKLAWRTLLWLWPKLSGAEHGSIRRDMRELTPYRYRRAFRPIVSALVA